MCQWADCVTGDERLCTQGLYVDNNLPGMAPGTSRNSHHVGQIELIPRLPLYR